MSNWDELITESRKLDEIASQIQQGETVGLTKEEIDILSSRYYLWYRKCLSLLPEDFKQKFRSEYDGSLYSSKIKKFLTASTKPYKFRPNDKQGKAIWSYWAYPYEKTFAPCILRQRQILIEVKASRPSISASKHTFSDEEVGNVQSLTQHYPYDVALSFAGEDRIHAEALADALRCRRINVFYDKYEKATLWGKDLYTHLSDLYQKKARYCVMFFSQHYIVRAWTRHELKAAQARALNENEEYILPIRLDSTEIPGILQTIAYLDWYEETPESVAEALLEKLRDVPQIPLISERTIMNWLIDEAQLSNGRVGVEIGDVPGVKHFMSMEKDGEDWEAWYGMWFHQAFTERMGFEPTEESVAYALARYAELVENPTQSGVSPRSSQVSATSRIDQSEKNNPHEKMSVPLQSSVPFETLPFITPDTNQTGENTLPEKDIAQPVTMVKQTYQPFLTTERGKEEKLEQMVRTILDEYEDIKNEDYINYLVPKMAEWIEGIQLLLSQQEFETFIREKIFNCNLYNLYDMHIDAETIKRLLDWKFNYPDHSPFQILGGPYTTTLNGCEYKMWYKKMQKILTARGKVYTKEEISELESRLYKIKRALSPEEFETFINDELVRLHLEALLETLLETTFDVPDLTDRIKAILKEHQISGVSPFTKLVDNLAVLSKKGKLYLQLETIVRETAEKIGVHITQENITFQVNHLITSRWMLSSTVEKFRAYFQSGEFEASMKKEFGKS